MNTNMAGIRLISKYVCILTPWKKVALASEGLTHSSHKEASIVEISLIKASFEKKLKRQHQ